jgi:hypothetical protein
MSFKEVKELRKAGHLQQALEVATSDLQHNPNDIWNKRSIAWVYYEYLKKAQDDNVFDAFVVQLEHIRNLELPETENMVFDGVAWQVGKYLFANRLVNALSLDSLFSLIRNFRFSKPADSYSFLLKAFKKHAAEWDNFLGFIEWWDLANFQGADYENFVLDNGKKMPSVVESVYIAVSKKLLAQPVNIEAVNQFLPQISEVCRSYPKMQYTHYYHAKLLIASGDKHRFLDAFLPFAKKKQRDFWVWDLMSEIYNPNSDAYFSCLCKSLDCGAPDKFTINVREKIAAVFVSKQLFAEAKHEYQKIIEARNKEGWPLKDKHFAWKSLPWWSQTQANSNNHGIYKKSLSEAESLLYADTPEEIICIDYVNAEKQVFNFIASKQKFGFSSFKPFDVKPVKGDIFAARFSQKTDEKSNFYRLLSIRKTEKEPSAEIYKTIFEKLNKQKSNSFGFVAGAFVSPQLIRDYGLKNGDLLKGVALQTYNNKRKSWGWTVVAINN